MMRRLFFLSLTAATLVSFCARAEDSVPAVANPLVQKECGTCHMAFQPAFLPERSWNRIMDSLSNHFGETITLPSDTARKIRSFLTENAADTTLRGLGRHALRGLSSDDTPTRITETPAFLRKHDFPDRVWKNPKVVTLSNCPACHLAADKGIYEDD